MKIFAKQINCTWSKMSNKIDKYDKHDLRWWILFPAILSGILTFWIVCAQNEYSDIFRYYNTSEKITHRGKLSYGDLKNRTLRLYIGNEEFIRVSCSMGITDSYCMRDAVDEANNIIKIKTFKYNGKNLIVSAVSTNGKTYIDENESSRRYKSISLAYENPDVLTPFILYYLVGLMVSAFRYLSIRFS